MTPTFQGKPPWKEGPAVVAGSLEGFSAVLVNSLE